MATINLGRIKPVFQGAYNASTAYVVDDIVTFGGESFICILASTGNATSNATYWSKIAKKGDDVTQLTTHGDFLFRDAGFIMIKKNCSKTQLKNLFPQHAAKINKITAHSEYSSTFTQRDLESSKVIQPEDISNTYTPEAEEDQIVPYYENYSKIKVPFVNAFIRIPLTEEQEQQLQQSVDVQLQEFSAEMEVQLQEK